jgi:hypothetical protein
VLHFDEIVVSARNDTERELWILWRNKQVSEELLEVPISLEAVPRGPKELQALAFEEAGLA